MSKMFRLFAMFVLCATLFVCPSYASSSAGIARGIVNNVVSCGTGCVEVEVQDLTFSAPFYMYRIQFVGVLEAPGSAIQCGMYAVVSYLPRIVLAGASTYYLQATGDKLSASCQAGTVCGCPTP